MLLLRRRLGRQLLRLRVRLWVQQRLRVRLQRRLRLLLSQAFPQSPLLISCLERAAGPEGPALRGRQGDRPGK